jgi:hypothetical protein
MMVGTTALMAQADKEMIEGLNKAGFKTNMGVDNAGIAFSVCFLL